MRVATIPDRSCCEQGMLEVIRGPNSQHSQLDFICGFDAGAAQPLEWFLLEIALQ